MLAAFAVGLVSFWLLLILAAHFHAWLSSKPIDIGEQLSDLVRRSGVKRLHVRLRDLSGSWVFPSRTLAMATWTPWAAFIYLDQKFLSLCDLEQLKLVFAHELGHHALGHTRKSFVMILTGAVLARPCIPMARRAALHEEQEGDAWFFAELLTGIRNREALDRGPLHGYMRGLA